MKQLADPLIVIPAFNESSNVSGVVGDVIAKTGLPVLVVDDASADDTAAKAAEAGASVISLATQMGAWEPRRLAYAMPSSMVTNA